MIRSERRNPRSACDRRHDIVRTGSTSGGPSPPRDHHPLDAVAALMLDHDPLGYHRDRGDGVVPGLIDLGDCPLHGLGFVLPHIEPAGAVDVGDAVAGGREVGDAEYSHLIELTAALGLVPAIPLKLLYRPNDGLRVDGPAAFLGYNVFLFDLIGNRKPPAGDGGRGPVLLDLDLSIEPGPGGVGAQRRSPASCSAYRRISAALLPP